MSAQSFAILLLIVGNLAASLSDVAVKLLNGEVSSFQYVFIRQLLSTIVILPLWLRQNKAERGLIAKQLTAMRAQLVLIGSSCMLVAITHLSLATANAVFYAAPLLMLPLSALLLKETPSMTKIIASFIGFSGVLVVLRPSEFHWAAIFALGTAITIALFNVTARKLPAEQPIISTLFWTSALSLPIAGVLAFVTWQPLSIELLSLILISAGLILGYNGLAISAYRRAPASSIAIAENSGLLFVTLFGVLWFSEVPDWLTAVGIMMIILPLLPWHKIKR